MTIKGMVPSVLDLHLHSSASDGELTPAELVQQAFTAGIRCLALTDHDTVAGLTEAEQHCERLGLEFVPGVEISALWREMDIHVVGLQVDQKDANLLQRLSEQQEKRLQRAHGIARKLAKLGYENCFEAAVELTPQKIPARPHFAEVLVQKGACRDKKQAFQRFLAVAKPAYVKTEWPGLEEIVHWIRAAGGVATLAHPGRYRLTRSKLNALIDEFARVGGQALEVATATQTPEQIKLMASLAQKNGLFASQGSDFHGPSNRWIRLGWLPTLPVSCRPVMEILGRNSR